MAGTARNHRPVKRTRLRICQALILPHKQKQGLGRELLLAAYRLASERSHVTEITVEDPCPGFQALRDQVDFELFAQKLLPTAATSGMKEETIVKELKITKAQAAFLLEMQQFLALLRNEPPRCALTDRDALLDHLDETPCFKTFRLSIKRLFVQRDKELMAMSKEDRQQELQELFNERLQRYLAMLPLVIRIGAL